MRLEIVFAPSPCLHPSLTALSWLPGPLLCCCPPPSRWSWGFQYLGDFNGSDGKESAVNAGDLGSVPGLGRSPGGGNGNPLQYFCLDNSMDRGAWWATVYESERVGHDRVANSFIFKTICSSGKWNGVGPYGPSPRLPSPLARSSTCFCLWKSFNQRLNLVSQRLSYEGFPHSSVGKSSACKAGEPGSNTGLGRSAGEGNWNPLQYSCLENPLDRGAWQATAHRIARIGHDLATKPPLPSLIQRSEKMQKQRKIVKGDGIII